MCISLGGGGGSILYKKKKKLWFYFLQMVLKRFIRKLDMTTLKRSTDEWSSFSTETPRRDQDQPQVRPGPGNPHPGFSVGLTLLGWIVLRRFSIHLSLSEADVQLKHLLPPEKVTWQVRRRRWATQEAFPQNNGNIMLTIIINNKFNNNNNIVFLRGNHDLVRGKKKIFKKTKSKTKSKVWFLFFYKINPKIFHWKSHYFKRNFVFPKKVEKTWNILRKKL